MGFAARCAPPPPLRPPRVSDGVKPASTRSDSVTAFVEALRASALRASGGKLHVLVNNAGFYARESGRRTKQGLEAAFGVMHVGHQLLTTLLQPELAAAGADGEGDAAGARVVNVSSLGHNGFRAWPASFWEGDGEGDLRGEAIDGGFMSCE